MVPGFKGCCQKFQLLIGESILNNTWRTMGNGMMLASEKGKGN